MAIFGKDNKKEKLREAARRATEKRKEELRKIIAGSPDISLPTTKKMKVYPTEYRDFLREIKRKPLSLYERAASLAENLVPFKIDPNFGGIGDSAKAGYLNITTKGVIGLTILAFLLVLVSTVLIQNYANSSVFSFIFLTLGLVATYLVYNHPKSNAQVVVSKMSADSVLGVLYMVVYMRSSPNLEGAIRFASETLSGPLSWDLKKLLWEIQLGTYQSGDAALVAYITKWKSKNTEFAESLNLLRNATIGTKRREDLYDQVVNIILTGTAIRSRRYVSNLRLPITLIHAMGILLPIMGLVLFPIVVIFMSQAVKPAFLFLTYDLILPLALWFIIDYTLKARPPTFSQPDISLAKGVPPLGKLKIGEMYLPVWIFALLIALPITFIGYNGLAAADQFGSVNYSILFVVGLASAVIAYTLLDSFQKIKIREDIEKIEQEFSVALFQLGNQLNSGYPIEVAIDRSMESLKGLKIAEMFRIASDNMRRFGYSFEQAFFDPKIGAVWYYPSHLIRSIMLTVVESSKKGMSIAAVSMITISKYLQSLSDVKESVSDVLGETTASMLFLAQFLTPLVAGVTVTMAVVIIQILTQLGTQLSALAAQGSQLPTSTNLFVIPWVTAGGVAVTPAVFQIVVGIYMVEIAILLSMFLNRIEFGEDAIGLRSIIWKTLVVALIVYAISWFVTFGIFGNSIQSLLVPSGLS